MQQYDCFTLDCPVSRPVPCTDSVKCIPDSYVCDGRTDCPLVGVSIANKSNDELNCKISLIFPIYLGILLNTLVKYHYIFPL